MIAIYPEAGQEEVSYFIIENLDTHGGPLTDVAVLKDDYPVGGTL